MSKTFSLLLLAEALLCAAEPGFRRIPVTDASVYFSPYNTYSDGEGSLGANSVRAGSTYVQWINPGAYFKAGFTGSSFRVRIDTTAATKGVMPKVQWSLDNAPLQTRFLARGDDRIEIASHLDPQQPHSLVFYLSATDGYVDRWAGPVQSLKITGLDVDPGATALPPSGPVAIEPRRALLFGDSITEGMWLWGDSKDASMAVTYDDASNAWPAILAEVLDAEYGVCGFGKQSWTRPTPDIPPLPQSWALFFKGHSRLIGGKLQPRPDYVFVNMGTNDSVDLVAAAAGWLRTIRAALERDTPLFMIIPFGQRNAAGLKTAVAQVQDPHIEIIDLGPKWAFGMNKYGVPSRLSHDGLHPNALANGRFAAALARAVGASQGRRR